uniref:Uncharacterized protein n=1 Tax=Onchocerca volvulus TaxID=6282 RepID=A0A8R1Y5V9_ONCVO
MIQYETQFAGLQKQRALMDQEMTLLCFLNNSKDVLIQALQAKSENDKSEDRNDRIQQLQVQIKIMSQEVKKENLGTEIGEVTNSIEEGLSKAIIP